MTKRKKWFNAVKGVSRVFIKRSGFIYLGEQVERGGIILSNHVGTTAPLAWELYSNKDFRFWGAHEMNSGLISLYKYLSGVYYHEKKHWNLTLARLFCLIAAPVANLYYKGINLISTYRDGRLKKTIKESYRYLSEGGNVVIFPEISDNGYLDVLEGFHHGFVLLFEYCKKKGLNPPIYVAYYKKSTRTYVIDKPISLDELFYNNPTREQIAERLCNRCNELGASTAEKLTDNNIAA